MFMKIVTFTVFTVFEALEYSRTVNMEGKFLNEIEPSLI